MSHDKEKGWCERIQALQSAGMQQHMKILHFEEVDRDFLLMEFDVTAELIERGYLDSNGDVILLNSTTKRKSNTSSH